VEAWLAHQAAEHDEGRQRLQETAQKLRHDLARIDGRRDKVLADYEAAVTEGDSKARVVLEVVAKLDDARVRQERRIADTDAALAEWATWTTGAWRPAWICRGRSARPTPPSV
jgi:hypothetical protein